MVLANELHDVVHRHMIDPAHTPPITGCMAVANSQQSAQPDGKPLINIGICTRLRNDKLARLLQSLAVQTAPNNWRIAITIIDNNDLPAAHRAVETVSLPFEISVHHQPEPGLVFARNMALELAQQADATWFIGLDDDEWVAEDWLLHFIAALDDPGPFKMFMGPCELIYAKNASDFVSKAPPKGVPFGKPPQAMSTQNFAIHRDVFDPATGPGLRFHFAFNETGGEDLEFFLRATRAHGFEASAVPDALVFEDRKGERATLRYRLFRRMRNQLSILRINHLHCQDGFYGTRWQNAKAVALLTNRSVVFGVALLIKAIALVPFNRPRAKLTLGHALQRGALLAAVALHLLRRAPKVYGAAGRPN